MFPHPDAPKIRAQVEAYFDKNWLSCGVPYQFTRTGSEEREQIIDIATTIKMNEMGIDTRSGSFIQAFLNNDLKATFAKADSINRDCIRFYLTMSYNLGISL